MSQLGNVHEITGGTLRGSNLFHSFDRFSVGTGDIASFNEPFEPGSGAGITNILGRVTGLLSGFLAQSVIDGTLQSTIPGSNLFLVNPAGVLFGPNALLNVGGSVAISTADYLRLADGARFEAIAGAQDALLSSAPVAAFGFLGPNAAAIAVQGSTLQVTEGQALSFVGGDLPFTTATGEAVAPGITVAGGTLSAPSGQINLVSVASGGEVLLPNLQTGPNVNNESLTNLGPINLSQGSTMDVSGDGGGIIKIRGGQLVLDNAFLMADTVADTDGATTAVDVNVLEDITLNNGSTISVSSFGLGQSGDILMTGQHVQLDGSSIFIVTTDAVGGNMTLGARDLTLINGANIVNATLGTGDGGSTSITVQDSLTVSGTDPFGNPSRIESLALSFGNAGVIDIATSSATLDGGKVQTLAFDVGNAGDTTFASDTLSIVNGGAILTGGGAEGSAGNLLVDVAGNLSLSGVVPGPFGGFEKSRIENTSGFGLGQSGNTVIQAGSLVLANEAQIISESVFNTGGSLSIAASDSVSMSGNSNILVKVGAVSGGPLEIQAPEITLDQSKLQTATAGSGNAGALVINTGSLNLSHSSLVTSETEQGLGNGGPITITASGSINLSGASSMRTNTFTLGAPAGEISLAAGNSVSLSGAGTGLFSETRGQGNGGAITVQANQVQVSDGAVVSAKSTGTGNAGSVTIEGTQSPAESVVIDGVGSGIFTTTEGTGAGGNIGITANTVTLQNGGTLSAATSGTAASATGGAIAVNAGTAQLSSGAMITAESTGLGDAGSITLTTTGNTVTLAGGSRISSSSTGTMPNAGDAGSVTINAGNSFQSSGSTVATSAAQGQGGNITITASQEATLNNGTNITASSSGLGDAGNIVINAGGQFLATNSSVTTQAAQAGGGKIEIKASDMVRLTNSQINTSVADGTGGGGDITIDPNFVVLQNSQILANAFAGPGGNITITALVPPILDANSLIDASSQFGVNGTVTIQAPTSNLSAVWARLQQNYTEAAALLRARCAAQVSGQYSSFVQTGRDAVPLEPGGWLLSPVALSADAGRGARGEGARSVVASSVLASEGGILSLRGFDQNLSWPGLGKAPRRFVSILDSACGS